MAQPNPLSESEIDLLRDASRRLARRLGFLEEGLAGTGLPPSSVHALIEIEARPACTATDLAGVLLLEKSSVSRLVETGLVSEAPGAADGRTKALARTGRGAALAAEIHGFARRQAAGALARLEPGQRRTVAEGIALYAEALGAEAAPAVRIEAGYRCGCLARCVELHALHYAREAGFGRAFEALVAAGLAEFSGRLERSGNAIWLARRAGPASGATCWRRRCGSATRRGSRRRSSGPSGGWRRRGGSTSATASGWSRSGRGASGARRCRSSGSCGHGREGALGPVEVRRRTGSAGLLWSHARFVGLRRKRRSRGSPQAGRPVIGPRLPGWAR